MLSISKARETPIAGHVRALNIVPVSISYEWDPCDGAKARELHLRASEGDYAKEEHEDVASIAHSITSPKGAVHVSFGEPLDADFAGPDEVAAEIDRQVLALYRVHPSNLAAFRMLQGRLPEGFADDAAVAAADVELRARLEALPAPHRPYLLAMYANPAAEPRGPRRTVGRHSWRLLPPSDTSVGMNADAPWVAISWRLLPPPAAPVGMNADPQGCRHECRPTGGASSAPGPARSAPCRARAVRAAW